MHIFYEGLWYAHDRSIVPDQIWPHILPLTGCTGLPSYQEHVLTKYGLVGSSLFCTYDWLLQ